MDRRGLYILLCAIGLLGSQAGVAVAAAQSEPSPLVQPLVQRGGPLERARSAQSVVDLARANAAAQAGAALEDVSVVSIQPVEWSDFRLGCPSPRPDMVFAQVVVPGFLVEIDVAGSRLSYHTDGGLRAILCDPPALAQPADPPPSPVDEPHSAD